jgi:aspartate kinase
MRNPGIMTDTRISKLTIHAVPDRQGIAAEIFGRLGEAELNVSILTVSGGAVGRSDISFTVGREDVERTAALLEAMRTELGAASISRRDDVAAVSLVAEQMHRTPGVAGRMFRVLSAAGINIDMISATAAAVTCVIDARFLDAAVESLRQEFHSELARK